MAKKFTTKTHLTDANGNLVAPGTEIEESLLGDADVIARYKSLDAVEDTVIQTGEVAAEGSSDVSINLHKGTIDDSAEGGKVGEKIDDSFDELNRHKRAELAEMAAAEGVAIGESETKAQIIEKILANRSK